MVLRRIQPFILNFICATQGVDGLGLVQLQAKTPMTRSHGRSTFDTSAPRMALLAGVSLTALALAAPTLVAADVVTTPLVEPSFGKAGTDRDNPTVGNGKTGGTGGNSSALTVRVTDDYEIENDGPAISIISAGGKGGDGQFSTLGNGGSGGNGGTAAAVTLSTSASGGLGVHDRSKRTGRLSRSRRWQRWDG